MACTGRYAEAWEYLSFWCNAQLLEGFHQGAGPADAALSDTYANFINAGAKANVGQILYNVTQGTSGYITAATENSLTAAGVTWANGDEYRSAFIDQALRSRIENNLDKTYGPIAAALSAVGACDCAYSAFGTDFLANLNIVMARVYYNCPCSPDLSDADKRLYSEQVESSLAQIREMKIDVCEGETGSAYPVFGSAERSWNEFAAAEIIVKDTERNRS